MNSPIIHSTVTPITIAVIIFVWRVQLLNILTENEKWWEFWYVYLLYPLQTLFDFFNVWTWWVSNAMKYVGLCIFQTFIIFHIFHLIILFFHFLGTWLHDLPHAFLLSTLRIQSSNSKRQFHNTRRNSIRPKIFKNHKILLRKRCL